MRPLLYWSFRVKAKPLYSTSITQGLNILTTCDLSVGAAFQPRTSHFSRSWRKIRVRKGRSSEIGRYYLLTTSTRNRVPIFTLPEAAKIVLSSLHWFDKKGQINLEAAVIMPDHVHFIAQLCSGSLTTLMHTLKGYTARKINQQLNRKGPLWQPQYHDHAIRKDEVLHEITLYCLHNPVRAGLVKVFNDYPYWYCRWQV